MSPATKKKLARARAADRLTAVGGLAAVVVGLTLCVLAIIG